MNDNARQFHTFQNKLNKEIPRKLAPLNLKIALSENESISHLRLT